MIPKSTYQAEARFRCKVGGEMKPLSAFSNKQQKNLKLLAQRGRTFDANNSGMTCKEHTSGNRTEMRCEMCRLVKPLDDFSKASRRNGEQQCRRCTAWVEIQEPGVTPGPLQTGHISPEEELHQSNRQQFLNSQQFFDEEDSITPQAPVTSLAALGIDDKDDENASEIVSKFCQSNDSDVPADFLAASSLPPHLRKKVPTPSISSVLSAAASSKSSTHGGENLPPHLRAKAKSLAATTSGPISSTASSAGSLSLPTTLAEADSETNSMTNQSYNAWGPDGLQQRRVQSTVESDDVSTVAAEEPLEEDDPNVVGDWGRVPKTATLAPQGPRRKGGWWKKSDDSRMPAAAIRESLGDVHQAYVSRDLDRQTATRPIGFDSDSD